MTIFSPSISIRITPQPIPLPPAGIFAFVLYDWMLAMYDYKPRSLYSPTDGLADDHGYPQMVPLDPRIGVKLTERLQWWWFEQLAFAAPRMGMEDLKNAWRGLTKRQTAFCNNAGTEQTGGRRNYINDWNTSAREYPILWENTCGGHVVELYSREEYARGYKVKALKVSDYDKWKGWNLRTHPQYFTKATNATVIPYGDKWRVDAMHYLGGADVPIPLMSETGFLYIAKERVRLLEPNEAWPGAYYP